MADPNRQLHGRIAIYKRLAKMTAAERKTMTSAASKAWLAKFEREVDPDGTLPDEERARRATYARKSYMQQMARKREAAKRERKGAKA